MRLVGQATVNARKKVILQPSLSCTYISSTPSNSQKNAILYHSVGHNLILAHAFSVKLYRENYQKVQGGTIGISLDCPWYMPYDENDPKCNPLSRLPFDVITYYCVFKVLKLSRGHLIRV